MPNNIASTNAILDFPRLLNIFLFYGVACIIILSIRESKNMLEINKFDRIIVANWKLNGSIDFIEQYLQELNCRKLENSNNCGIICTPSVYFHKLVGRLNPLFLGGQDCSNYSEGAYTGEVSATMLKDASCQFCIIGHSERRQIFGQSNEDVCIKAMNLIANNINPIICIGETFEEKNKNLTKDIIYTQISKSVPKNATKDFVIIAYEPIWAIGTGKIPSLEEIDNIHSFIKNEIQNIENYKILYGGSVNSNNASEIMDLKNVDGVLVGGASLDALEYKKIMNS